MGSKQVHIRVGEERRDQWGKHADANGYSSVSELIRNAVSTQMAVDKGAFNTNGDSSGSEPNGRLDDTLAQAQDNGQTLERIEEKLARLSETVTAQGAVGDKVASDVWGAIPESTAGAGTDLGDMITPSEAATPTEIAESAGVDAEAAAGALAQMRRRYDDVHMHWEPTDDEPSYWREGGL